MFDHLVSPHAKPKKRLRMHHHVSVAALVIGVVTTVVVVNMRLPKFSPTGVSVAQEATIAFRLINPSEPQSVVGPLVNHAVLTAGLEVRRSVVSITGFTFLMNGVYDPAGIEGMALYIDGTQVGMPVVPDEQGAVKYRTETLHLRPGSYRLEVRMTTNTQLDGATFQTFIDPELTVMARSAAVRYALPYSTEVLNLVPSGNLGAFIKPGSMSGSVNLYAKAEDFKLRRISVRSDMDLSGGRIDMFIDGRFIASGVFDGMAAEIDLSDTVVRVLRDKNLEITFLPQPLPSGPTIMTLGAVDAVGITSQTTVTIEPSLVLLQN